jgi:hypothetical protein
MADRLGFETNIARSSDELALYVKGTLSIITSGVLHKIDVETPVVHYECKSFLT